MRSVPCFPPLASLTKMPSLTLQLGVPCGLRSFHPVKSLPLKRGRKASAATRLPATNSAANAISCFIVLVFDGLYNLFGQCHAFGVQVFDFFGFLLFRIAGRHFAKLRDRAIQ